MHWVPDTSCFLGGAILVNARPHLVGGPTGRPFQTPFAKPPGKGLSSATVNVLRGFLDLAAGGILACRFGHFFGRLHGGDLA